VIRIGELAAIIAGTFILLGSLAVTASIANFREMVDPELEFRVLGNETAGPKDGVSVLSGHYVDVLRLNISLANLKESFSLTIPYFFAWTGNGTSLWCQGMLPMAEPVIPAGGSIEIGIYFQVPIGEIVRSLEYIKPSGERIDIPVPIF
jgi:hypothetical protein